MTPELNPYEAPQSDSPRDHIGWFWAFIGKNLWLAFELQVLGIVIVLIGAQITIVPDGIVSTHQILLRIYAGIACLALLVMTYAVYTKQYGFIGIELVIVFVAGLAFLEWMPRIQWG